MQDLQVESATSQCRLRLRLHLTQPSIRPAPSPAITTLLKTGNESSVDKLLKQIGGFMGEITDDFKVGS